MARVVVEVMPKPEILDPQGKAVTGALERLGFTGLQVRQGKLFEIEVDGEITDDVVTRVREAADKLLANTVIENFEVHIEKLSVEDKAENADQTKAEKTGKSGKDAKK
ncbi:phosphoribosylformylglycinamidine synthase subunit PurS [Naumannella sp. ID2617S]|uniref:Phosphoribosylformylglycinamidine synthase subunit PurS n=1 Tax=Enemella dayhoffiae TaxID=2016507 RepID=A0A255H7E0_9ACTN|nr:phosphoribosylformylglycinamidine synthase subunit PurS [Naumannella sp. ID2617S]OYO23489.1 phosphoribosylformylglycinamidine synthase subunit PurS [Enemella dayhoffiae]